MPIPNVFHLTTEYTEDTDEKNTPNIVLFRCFRVFRVVRGQNMLATEIFTLKILSDFYGHRPGKSDDSNKNRQILQVFCLSP